MALKGIAAAGRMVAARLDAAIKPLDDIDISLSSAAESMAMALCHGDLKEALKYPYVYPRTLVNVRVAMDMIREATGFSIRRAPCVVINHNERDMTRAMYENERITIFGQAHAGMPYMMHEAYHSAEDWYRGPLGMDGTFKKFMENYPQAGSLGEKLAHDRAAWMWRGVNEAGAYLFAHYPTRPGTPAPPGQAILRDIEAFWKISISDAALHTLYVLEGGNGVPELASIHDTLWGTDVLCAITLAAIACVQNDFDTRRTLTSLLRPPQELPQLLRIDAEEARRSIDIATDVKIR